jgi:hypothetical protein
LNLDVANNELTRSMWSNLGRCLGEWTALQRCDMDVSGNICGVSPNDMLPNVDLRIHNHNTNTRKHNCKLPAFSFPMEEEELFVWMS